MLTKKEKMRLFAFFNFENKIFLKREILKYNEINYCIYIIHNVIQNCVNRNLEKSQDRTEEIK